MALNSPFPIIVAIPAKNEEERIGACLEALDNQVLRRADRILLLLNDCTDRTAQVVRALLPQLATAVEIVEVTLPPGHGHAGRARQIAMNRAEQLMSGRGVLMTTDADGQVDPDWVGANLRAIEDGADAVAGWVELDPIESRSIPLKLHEDDAIECAYDEACDELQARLDPDPWDQLPRHTQASGASIAVTAAAYRMAGGMPARPTGEDRAFFAALRRMDARIRHSPACRVVVSGRTEGRAVGGMADTIRRRLKAPEIFLDDRLEPAEDCARRAALRHLVRGVHKGDGIVRSWWKALDLTENLAKATVSRSTFGSAWAELERLSPRLARRRVLVSDVLAQHSIAIALREHAHLDPGGCRQALLRGKVGKGVSAPRLSKLTGRIG